MAKIGEKKAEGGMAEGWTAGATLVGRERTPGRHFDVYVRGTLPETYVDGISSVSASAAVVKIDCHAIVSSAPAEDGSGETHENRELRLRLVMPTGAFIESMVNVLTLLASGTAPLNDALDQQRQQIATLLARIGSKDGHS